MFDMQKIGKKLSSLRKEKGMTQMELADKMEISFQAVSNWERGKTMPDISKLPELAALFGVSIEEILGDDKKGKLVEELAGGNAPENVQAEDLVDVAPILPQETFNEALERNKDAVDENALLSLAPFMDEDDLKEIAEKIAGQKGKLSCIEALAPFMDERDLGELVKGGEYSIKEIAALAPFMDEGDIADAARLYFQKNPDAPAKGLEALAPFMDEDDLGEIAEKVAEQKGKLSCIETLAPYLDERDLGKIVKSGEYSTEELAALAPFMDEGDIADAARLFFQKNPDAPAKGLEALAPFMDEDDLADVVAEMLKRGKPLNDFSDVFSFLPSDFLKRIVYQK